VLNESGVGKIHNFQPESRNIVKRQWSCRERQFSAFSLAIFSNTLDMRPMLLYSDMQSVIGFSMIPKCMALNDLDWLFRVKFCFRVGLRFGWL